jgi:peptidoglycan/xylan/chitin deacetylase (PgdA/CDA1 family)
MTMPRRRSTLLAMALATSLLSTGIAGAAEPDSVTFPWPPEPWAAASEMTIATESLAPASEASVREMPPAATVVRKGRPSTGAVALTFDDGYNAEVCESIADRLRRAGAVGTFFINGQWLQQSPVRWRRILDGMEVANHTRSHRNLMREPHPVVINQIRSNEGIHLRVLGRPMLKVLRPPYGAHGPRVDRIARWNVDTQDWRPKARARGIVRRAIDAPPGSIVLMHCGRPATAQALPAIIRHYQARGIELAGLSKVLTGARGGRRGGGNSTYGE